jgi:hypothetical protein
MRSNDSNDPLGDFLSGQLDGVGERQAPPDLLPSILRALDRAPRPSPAAGIFHRWPLALRFCFFLFGGSLLLAGTFGMHFAQDALFRGLPAEWLAEAGSRLWSQTSAFASDLGQAPGWGRVAWGVAATSLMSAYAALVLGLAVFSKLTRRRFAA